MTKFVKYSQPHHMAFLPQLHSKDGNSFHPKMDHLSCFAAGMLALGYLHGFPEAHLVTAQNLTHTCYQMYHQSPTGLSPDEVTFNTNKQSSLDFRASVRQIFSNIYIISWNVRMREKEANAHIQK